MKTTSDEIANLVAIARGQILQALDTLEIIKAQALDYDIIPPVAVPVTPISNISEQSITSTTAVIGWDVAPAAGGQVFWGLNPADLSNAGPLGTDPYSTHSYNLSGLPPGETIYYQIASGGAASPIQSFPTKSMSDLPSSVTATTSTSAESVDLIADKFMDQATGDDSNAGTFASPWRTFNHSQGQLKPGDTLVIRATTVKGNSINIDSSGQAGKEITIRNMPGEAVIFDSSLEFTGWTLEDASLNIYSADEATTSDDNWTAAYWTGAAWEQLVYYENKADFYSTRTTVSTGAWYTGPGIFYENGRIKMRTEPLPASTLSGAPASTLFNPNTTAVKVSNKYQTLEVKAHHVTLHGIQTMGAIMGVEIQGSASHVLVTECAINNPLGVYVRPGASIISVTKTNFDLVFPRWLSWTSLKGGATHHQPASHWSQRVTGVNAEGVKNLLVSECHYAHALDGGVWTSVINGLFEKCTGEIIDDTVQIGTDCENVVIFRNTISGAGPSHNGKGDPANRSPVQVVDNVFAAMQVLWGVSDPDDLLKASYKGMQWTNVIPTHTSKKLGAGGDPWYLYNNEFICYTLGKSKGTGLGLWEARNTSNKVHSVFNNVIRIMDNGYYLTDVNTSVTGQYFNSNRIIGGRAYEDTLPGKINSATLANWKSSKLGQKTGWDSNSVDTETGGTAETIDSSWHGAAEMNAHNAIGATAR
jgi:hypothetical protein